MNGTKRLNTLPSLALLAYTRSAGKLRPSARLTELPDGARRRDPFHRCWCRLTTTALPTVCWGKTAEHLAYLVPLQSRKKLERAPAKGRLKT